MWTCYWLSVKVCRCNHNDTYLEKFMDYDYLKKDPQLNPNSTCYIPTMEEAGIPQKLMDDMFRDMDDPIKTERHQRLYDSYILKYQTKHREKVKMVEKAKSEKRERKLLAHWFNTLLENELIQLIDDSRRFADQVFDELNNRVTSTWELQYIEKLRIRVKTGVISVRPAADNKLKRFPNYNASKGSLHGSVYTFYRLWAHVFKSYSRSGAIDTSKR